MKYPKFAEHLKELRLFRNKTVYEVAEANSISPTYISQMENGQKLPSQDLLFSIARFLGLKNDKGYILKMTNDEFDGTKLIKIYADYKKLDKKVFLNRFISYTVEQVKKDTEVLFNNFELKKENKLKINKNTKEITALDTPFFDLEWLLHQKDFYVFYGHDYDIREVQKKKKSIETNDFYNTLPEEDIKMISALIKTYISNKYEKVKK